jgi:hypothetical protein
VLGHAETLLAAMRHMIIDRKPPPGPSFMRFAESTIREKNSPDRQEARGWDGRFARTECCSAARWDAQNITKLDQYQDRHASDARRSSAGPAYVSIGVQKLHAE